MDEPKEAGVVPEEEEPNGAAGAVNEPKAPGADPKGAGAGDAVPKNDDVPLAVPNVPGAVEAPNVDEYPGADAVPIVDGVVGCPNG